MSAPVQGPSAQQPAQQSAQRIARCRRLARALEMTERMLTHAQCDEWEQVIVVERERREDLAACFAEPVGRGDEELLAEAMAALLHLNEQLMSLLRDARAQAMAQGSELAGRRQALDSYRAVKATEH